MFIEYASTHIWKSFLTILCHCLIACCSFQAEINTRHYRITSYASRSHCCFLNHNDASQNSHILLAKLPKNTPSIVPLLYSSRRRPASLFGVYVSKKDEWESNSTTTTTFSIPDSYDDSNDPLLFDEDMYRPKIPNDLRPPLLNWRRGSILFDDVKSSNNVEDSSSSLRFNSQKRNTDQYVQMVWKFCQTYLPRIVHGSPPVQRNSLNRQQQKQIFTAYTTRTTTATTDRLSSTNNNVNNVENYGSDSTALLYNMVFVRIPTIMIGFIYIYNLLSGHPLICDLGFYGGPTEIHPIVVLGVLWMILR